MADERSPAAPVLRPRYIRSVVRLLAFTGVVHQHSRVTAAGSATDGIAPRALPIEALQDGRFQQFYGYSHFNPVQTQVFHALFRTDGNVLGGGSYRGGKPV